MASRSKTTEVTEIVHAMASLPGSKAFNVVAKSFPRVGPAEPGTSYRENVRTFTADAIPEAVHVQPDSDEIVIVMQGRLDSPAQKDELIEQVNTIFADEQVSDEWDIRAKFSGKMSQTPAVYEVTVFTNVWA